MVWTHLKNMLVKMGSSSPNRGEKNKYLKPPHRMHTLHRSLFPQPTNEKKWIQFPAWRKDSRKFPSHESSFLRCGFWRKKNFIFLSKKKWDAFKSANILIILGLVVPNICVVCPLFQVSICCLLDRIVSWMKLGHVANIICSYVFWSGCSGKIWI